VRRQRSADDPGDEPEDTGWMQGLSTRLSAYSLSEEGNHGAPEDEEEDESMESVPERGQSPDVEQE
jgi:hypothetical protein